MLRDSHFAVQSFRLNRRRPFPAASLGRVPAAVLAVSLFIFPGAKAQSPGDDRPGAGATVPQALVDARIVKLPVVDGNDIRFKRLTSTSGLSQTRVAQIIQDDQGFLWFGTQHGLSRYDGYEFKVFNHDPERPNSLSGVFIYSLFKDRSGALWVGTDQFLERFDRTTETFKHYHVDTQDPIVTNIAQDSTGLLWLATPKGLYRLDPANGQIARYRHDLTDPASLSSSDVKSAGEDRTGTFWVANSEGLDKFDRATGKVTLRIPLRVSVREFSFHQDQQGIFWIIYGSGEGLAVFDRKTNRLTRYSFYQKAPPGAALTGVYAMLEDHDGTLWFATMGAGLLRFDREHRRFIRYGNHYGDLESLAEDRVIALLEDREGNIWAGLHAKAPNFFSSRPPQFETIQPGRHPDNLGEALVNTIYEDGEGALWLGAGGGLNRIDRKTGRYGFYQPAGPGVSTEVLTLLEDRSGALWVGTLGHGLSRFDRRTGRFKTFRHDPSNPSTISNDIVTRLFIDHTGTMWAATWDGLNRFDPATGRFTVYKRDPLSKTESYFEIAEDQRGLLWLGSTSGLIRFNPSTAQFTVFKHDPEDPRSLSDNTVNSVYVDRSGKIWTGTQNGLDTFDPQASTFTVYYERDGLGGNAVSCILEDEQSDLWVSSNKGLSRFDWKTKTFMNYSTADGLPGADLTGWGACFQSPSGEMLFAGFVGAVAFHPQDVRDNTYVPAVVLTDFRLSGAPVEVGIRSPLKVPITQAHDLTLVHDQNFFSLEFSALSFLSPATNRYRYKMEGLDSNWHEVGSEQRVVNYTTLPAGAYEFRVQGATSRGPWSEPGTALRIAILPPWWGTWWFRASVAALLLFLLWYVYHIRIRQLAWQFNMTLEARVGERTRIARDLHDTLLQSFQGLLLRFQTVSEILPARPVEAKQRLDSAIDQAAEAITEGRDAVQGLRLSTVETNDLPLAITAIGEELSAQGTDQNAAVLQVEVEGTPRRLHPILRDEVYRIAAEALRNAFRHAQARQIEVELLYEETQFRLRIRDDGKGMDPRVLRGDGHGRHYGLPGMRERAKLIGAKMTVWSELGSGTEVELSIAGTLAYAASPRRSWLSEKFFRKGRDGTLTDSKKTAVDETKPNS